MATLGSVIIYDLIANRPSAGIVGRLFFASDTGAEYYDDGSAWQNVGGGALPLTTKGDLVGFSTVIVRIPVGANGLVLTADSTATPGVSWQPGGGGGGGGALTLLEAQSASSSASLDFTASISATYDDYLIEITNVIPSAGGHPLLLQVSTDGGATYDTGTNYEWAALYCLTNPASGNDGSAADTGMVIGPGQLDSNTAWGGVRATLRLYNPLSGTFNTGMTGQTFARDSRDGNPNMRVIGGAWVNTTAVNAIRFIMAGGGTIASGTIRTYGISK